MPLSIDLFIIILLAFIAGYLVHWLEEWARERRIK